MLEECVVWTIKIIKHVKCKCNYKKTKNRETKRTRIKIILMLYSLITCTNVWSLSYIGLFFISCEVRVSVFYFIIALL